MITFVLQELDTFFIIPSDRVTDDNRVKPLLGIVVDQGRLNILLSSLAARLDPGRITKKRKPGNLL